MVKRKSETSLDEWLAQGVRRPEPATAIAYEVSETQTSNRSAPIVHSPTTAKPDQPAAAELAVGTVPVDTNQPQRPVTEVEAHEWFWLLLESVGYERW